MSTVRLTLLTPGLTAAARHGVVGGDEALDDSGRRQVERIALPDKAFARGSLLCAPERQCLQTAELLGARRHAAPTVLPDLRDWDLGSWTGRPVEEVAAADPASYTLWRGDPGASPHGGESLRALVDRGARLLSTLEGAVVAVACTPVVRAVVVAALDLPLATFWALDVEPAARVDLTLRAGRAALRWPGPAS